jgi:hypothetical protein
MRVSVFVIEREREREKETSIKYIVLLVPAMSFDLVVRDLASGLLAT